MRNSLGARVLLVIGFVAASLSYGGWVALRTVLDPGATHVVARNIVATPEVQKNLADQLQTEVDKELGEAHASPQVRRAVDQAVRDPRVAEAFADALSTVQRAVLSNSGTTVTLDARSLTSAVDDALAHTDPTLAAQLAQQAPLTATIDANKVPHLGRIHDDAQSVFVLAGLAALLLVGASLTLDHTRKAIARAGRRVAYLSIAPVLGFVLLPHLLGTTGATGVARVALEAYGSRVVPSGIALLIIGVAVVVASMFMRSPNVAAEPQPAEASTFLPGRPLFPPAAEPIAPAAPHRINESLRL